VTSTSVKNFLPKEGILTTGLCSLGGKRKEWQKTIKREKNRARAAVTHATFTLRGTDLSQKIRRG